MTASKFHNLFLGLERAHGVYRIEAKEGLKVKGRAETVISTVTDELWEDHLTGKQGIGIVPITDKSTVRWAAIDIDKYDGFSAEEFEANVDRLGLPLVLCKTKSGGVHAFLFLQEWSEASAVRDALAKWSYALGIPGEEIFPKQGNLASPTDVGNWINMPYFGGNDTSRYCIRAGKRLTMDEFLAYAESRRVSSLQDIVLTEPEGFEGAPPCLKFLAGKTVEPGRGRHNFLFNLAVFAARKYPESWQDRVRSWNRVYIKPSLLARDIKSTLDSVSRKKDYFYKCNDIPLAAVCNKTLCKECEYGIGGGEDDPGVLLKSLNKYLTDPPIWFLNINGSNIEIQDTDQFLSQLKFKRLCVDRLNLVPKRIKDAMWDQIIRELLSDVTEIQAPVGASESDQTWAMIDRFCTDRYIGQSREDLLNGNAFRDEDLIYFRPEDLIKFLETERRSKIHKPALWSQIKGKGAGSKVLTVKGKKIHTWTLPRNTFTEQTEDFDVRVPKSDF